MKERWPGLHSWWLCWSKAFPATRNMSGSPHPLSMQGAGCDSGTVLWKWPLEWQPYSSWVGELVSHADIYPEGPGFDSQKSAVYILRYFTVTTISLMNLSVQYSMTCMKETFPEGFTTSNQTRPELQALLQVTSIHRLLDWGHTETRVMAKWGAAG